MLLIALPLVVSGRRYTRSTLTTNHVAAIAEDWAEPAHWEILSAEYRDGNVSVRGHPEKRIAWDELVAIAHRKFHRLPPGMEPDLRIRWFHRHLDRLVVVRGPGAG